MLWRFIAWCIQNSAKHPFWDHGATRQQDSETSVWCCSENNYVLEIFCHLEVRLIALACWHSWTEWHILCFTTVTVPSHQPNDIQPYFCTALLARCVTAWTDCSLCDSVQKYCCTVTGGGFVNWFNSNCSQISYPAPANHHCRRRRHHHHHIFSRSSTFIAERQNVCQYKLYRIYCSIFAIIYCI